MVPSLKSSKSPTCESNQLSISVVIPVWNEAASISETVVRTKAAGVDEIIVVDGQSDDGTADFAGAAGAKVVSTTRGRGPQMNAGAQAAACDLILFLHADCGIDSEAIDQLSRTMAENRNRVAFGCFRQRIDAEGTWYRWIERGNAFRAKHLGWIYGDQALFIRRDVFLEVGGFPEIPLMEDLALSKKLKKYGRPAVLDGSVDVSSRRWRKQGVLYSTLRNWCYVMLYHVGVPPQRLACWYRNVR